MIFYSTIFLFITSVNNTFANDEYLADRIRIIASGEICVFERNPKNPEAKNDRHICSSTYASDEDRKDHGKQFNERMDKVFDDTAKKSMLDGFLESRRDNKGTRKFTAEQLMDFIKNLESPSCMNARKNYDHQKAEVEKKMTELKKQIEILDQNSESNLKSLVNSCSPYPQRPTKPAGAKSGANR